MFCQAAHADQKGLNVGGRVRIPRGQESQYLQYQLQNNGAGLRQMRIMPECVVGEGLNCGKTGTVLEQIIRANGGPTYQQMLIKAAGGEENFQRFAAYYGNNRNLLEQPIVYSSVWRNGSNRFLDSVTYTLGQPLSRTPVEGLRDVTSNFYWSPFKGQDPYRAFVDLKMSYGAVLTEQAAKITDLKQQLSQLNLEPDVLRFYQNNIARAISAMKGGRDEEFKQSILTLLSRPYSEVTTNPSDYGRVIVNEIPGGLVTSGQELTAGVIDSVIDSPLTMTSVSVKELGGAEFFAAAEGGGIGILPFTPLLFLLFLLGGDGSSGSSARITSIPPTPPPPVSVCPQVSPGGNGSGVDCPVITPPDEEKPRKVIEPSSLNAMMLLTLMLCLINYQKKHKQQLQIASLKTVTSK